MIRNTFRILSGVGEKLERKLWQKGILTWEDFLNAAGVDFLSPGRKELYDGALSDASARLRAQDAGYFKGALRHADHWRLFHAFKDQAVYLDIETSGFHPEAGGYPTVVGVYDGFDYRAFIMGEDLTAENLMDWLSGYKYLVTFFGAVFDIPFLEKSLPGFRLDVPHFDLCFGARRLGYRGGLKRLEQTFGIERDEDTRGMDGYEAVLLWNRARRGSEEALELLIRYNREDTVNLAGIAETLYRGLREATGIEGYVDAAA